MTTIPEPLEAMLATPYDHLPPDSQIMHRHYLATIAAILGPVRDGRSPMAAQLTQAAEQLGVSEQAIERFIDSGAHAYTHGVLQGGKPSQLLVTFGIGCLTVGARRGAELTDPAA